MLRNSYNKLLPIILPFIYSTVEQIGTHFFKVLRFFMQLYFLCSNFADQTSWIDYILD